MPELKIVSLYSAQGTSARKKGEIKKLISLPQELMKKAKTTKRLFDSKDSMKSNKKGKK